MTRTALILAAHGSRHEPSVNERIYALAAELGRRGFFDETGAAFHHGDPHFSAAFDRLTATDATVVPVFTSAGYYSELVLPREIARNRRFGEMTVRITPPLGTHDGVVDIVADRARRIMARFHIDPQRAALAVIGHGTPRHRKSRHTTRELAQWIARMRVGSQVVAAFLDDDPPVESILERAEFPNLVVVPFLIAVGPHALEDVPRRVGLDVPRGTNPPFSGRVGGRFVVCDAPLGADPRMVDLIADLALSGVDPRPSRAAPLEMSR